MIYSIETGETLRERFAGTEDTRTLTRSIVIPFYNEAGCVLSVLEEVRLAQPQAEIIAIDDGSTDETWQRICERPDITGIHLSRNRGQSAAMYAGMKHAKTDVVVLMDGDGQNDPSDIESLIERLKHADVVVGFRQKRRDRWSRRVASRLANRIRRVFLLDGVRDTGCSLKAFHRCQIELLVPFNGLHRYLPAIFKAAGLNIAEVPVNHRERAQGISKYTNWDRALRGIWDLIGVAWLLRRKVHYPFTEIRPSIRS
jgi:dolichol-phosphate mannosyltransferase